MSALHRLPVDGLLFAVRAPLHDGARNDHAGVVSASGAEGLEPRASSPGGAMQNSACLMLSVTNAAPSGGVDLALCLALDGGVDERGPWCWSALIPLLHVGVVCLFADCQNVRIR